MILAFFIVRSNLYIRANLSLHVKYSLKSDFSKELIIPIGTNESFITLINLTLLFFDSTVLYSFFKLLFRHRAGQ